MPEIVQSATFSTWLSNLADRRARARIQARIDRLSTGNPGDVKPVGKGISEMRVDYGPGYRVYFMQRGPVVAVLLCGGDKRTQSADVKRAIAIAKDWRDRPMARKRKTTVPGGVKETFSRYDTADYLKSEEDMVAYLEACMEEAGGDPAFIAAALGNIARARGMMQLAKETGLTREGLYKALSAEGNPSLGTVLKVMKALGLKLTPQLDTSERERSRAGGTTVADSQS